MVFSQGALRDTLDRLPPKHSAPHDVKGFNDLLTWAQTHGLKQIITCHAPVGPIADLLTQVRKPLGEQGISLTTIMAPYDRMTWPHATHGFFRFKDNIPHFIAQI